MARESGHQKAIQPDKPFEMEGDTGGASDGNSGGGGGAGVPDGDLGMRADSPIGGRSTEADREKLFPDAPKKPAPAEQNRRPS
jgi:hypothetical protein